MNFKNWLFTEEIWQNNTATVYHRTKPENISNILTKTWKTGTGDTYGKGLYTTFSISSQFDDYMKRYGTSIVKFKVTNLDQYVICHKSVAQQILGQKYKISDQLKRLNLTNLYKPEQIEDFDEMMETVVFSAKLAKKMYEINQKLKNKAKGIIYYGSNDGYCLVKYLPVEDNTISMLGYANDVPTNNLEKMQELETNCKKNEQGKCESPWITSTSQVAVKTLYRINKDKKPAYAKPKITDLSVSDLKKQKIDKQNWNLFKHKLKDTKNKDNILKFLIKSKKIELNDDANSNIIYDLLNLATNKDEIIKFIIRNKEQLTDENIFSFSYFWENPDEIIKLILEYKKEFHDNTIFSLLDSARNKDEIIKLIIQNKEQLTDNNINDLLNFAENPNEIRLLLKQYANITNQ